MLQEAVSKLTFTFLALAGVFGALALASPKGFAIVAGVGGRWIAPPKRASFFEAPIDIDQFVFKHSRLFGATVLIVVIYVALFFLGHIDAEWTPVFLLLVTGLSLLLALSGFIELSGKVSKIENQLADARIDSLTRLANRRAFDEELERRLAEVAHNGSGFCVALLDIDHFKQINDTMGHFVGDVVLSQGIAPIVSTIGRTKDLAARYGGDEFAIIYPATVLSDVVGLVEQLRATIAGRQLSLEDANQEVTVSIGVTASSKDDDVVSIMKRADMALYSAKNAGRNRTFFHDGSSCEPIKPPHDQDR